MRIGIDIDGCMTKYDEMILRTAKEYGLVLDHPAYFLGAEFNLTYEEEMVYWTKYYDVIQKNVEPRDNVSAVINRLHQRGNEIWIITGRSEIDVPPTDNSDFVETTFNWLKKNNIYYDKIFFRISNKGVFCQKYKVDLMIEDSPEQILYLNKKGIKTIIMNCSYNKNMHLDNTTHVNGWDEVDKLIK